MRPHRQGLRNGWITRRRARLAAVGAAVALLLITVILSLLILPRSPSSPPDRQVRPTDDRIGEPSATHSVRASPPPTERPVPTGAPSHTPTPTQTPRPSPSPTATRTKEPRPVVLSFRAQTDPVDPGDTVTVFWDTVGATSVVLYKMWPSGQISAAGIELPISGTYDYQLSEYDQNWASFLLYASDEAGNQAQATVEVSIRCTYRWFLSPPPEDICPTEPLDSPAAQQHFEHGVMIWVEKEDAVYVLYGQPLYTTHWTRFEDLWEEGEPEQDDSITAPEGLQQPRRGFGLVWREQPQVREQLGWAIAGEKAYTTVLQLTTRYKYNARYLLAVDGSVWHLGPEGSSWAQILRDEEMMPAP